MKQYQTQENGDITISSLRIPLNMDNRDYAQALKEVVDGDAEILPYVKPVNEDLDKQISDIESTLTLRRLREAVLTSDGKVWLQDVDDQIKILRDQKL